MRSLIRGTHNFPFWDSRNQLSDEYHARHDRREKKRATSRKLIEKYSISCDATPMKPVRVKL